MSVASAVSIAIIVVIFNVVLSRHVWTDGRRTKQQRIAEVGLVWCVPVFGGLVALALSADDPDRVRRAPALSGGAAADTASARRGDRGGLSQGLRLAAQLSAWSPRQQSVC